MKLPKLHIGDLTANIPIIQGGMGIGVSLSGLAGAVAKEGGIGVISAAQVGFNEPDFRTNTVKANIRALKEQIHKAREKAKTALSASISCGGVSTMKTMPARPLKAAPILSFPAPACRRTSRFV